MCVAAGQQCRRSSITRRLTFRRKHLWHVSVYCVCMLHRAQFEAADIEDRIGMLSTRGTCVLEHHAKQASSLFYTINDFFVELRFAGPEHHPCLSMTAFTTTDPLCDRMLLYMEQDLERNGH